MGNPQLPIPALPYHPLRNPPPTQPNPSQTCLDPRLPPSTTAAAAPRAPRTAATAPAPPAPAASKQPPSDVLRFLRSADAGLRLSGVVWTRFQLGRLRPPMSTRLPLAFSLPCLRA